MPFLPRSTFKIDVLDGGLNTKNTDITCPTNMSPYLAGFEFSDLGAAKLAKGSTAFCASLGTAPIDCLHTIYYGGAETILAAQSATVYHATATASTWNIVSGSTGVFTASVDVCARTVLDETYMTNGYATPHRFDGTNFYTIGVSAYTGGLTGTVAVTASAGSINGGVYAYGISGLNANGVESNVATFTTAQTISTLAGVTLSGLPAFFPTSAGVSTRYLYRTTAGSQTEFYRVTALTAAQTTVVDTASDSALVTAAQTDHFPPAKCKYFWYYKGRLYAAGDPTYPYRLYYSQAGQPEIWPALNAIEIGEGDGQVITGLAAMGNAITVHKTSRNGADKSIWLVYQPDSTDVSDATNWYVVKSPSAYSAASNKSIVFFENLMAFLDKTGVYAFTGEDIARGPATSQIGQYAADAISANIESEMSPVTDAISQAVPAINFDSKLWFGVRTHSGYDYLIYDYTTASKAHGIGAWATRVSVPSGTPNAFSTLGGNLHCSIGSQVWKIGTNYNDNGSYVSAEYSTPYLAGNKAHWDMSKIWRFIYLTVSDSFSSPCSLVVSWETESVVTGSSTVTASASYSSTIIRVPILNSSGNPITSKKLLVTITTSATNSNSAKLLQIHSMELEYLLRSRRT